MTIRMHLETKLFEYTATSPLHIAFNLNTNFDIDILHNALERSKKITVPTIYMLEGKRNYR